MPLSIGSAAQGLQPCQRFITTTDKTGKSVFTKAPEQVYTAIHGFGGVARSYTLHSFPANLADDADIKAYITEDSTTPYGGRRIVNTHGVNLFVVDHEPGGLSSPMHRTMSVDFVVCVQGEIECELDSGEKVRLRPGDHLVQRGTMHRWSNPSRDRPARAIACTIPCKPFDGGLAPANSKLSKL